ncbi:MAG: BON domain-containing protein [Verrucomicrobiota bacterium]
MKLIYPMLAAVLILPIGALAEEEKPVPQPPAQPPSKTPADNSAKNERDRDDKTLTPGDQSEKPEDLKLTQAIRQAIMKDKVLSITAKNIKIITASGRVTLRGPVNNADEKLKIHNLAKGAAGQVPVDNQLEVKAAK